MIAVTFEFLAGRYHATPWDRHTNEGAIEWPPSPWRILRALVAASYRLDPPPTAAELGQLLEKLTAPPVYRVPRGTEGHTRHYMPTNGKPTLVFDAFIAVGGGVGAPDATVVVGWPEVEIEAEEINLLDRLLAAIGYLGRAESWVTARRIDWPGQEANVTLASSSGAASVRGRVRLQAPMREAEYDAWRRTAPKPKGRGGQLPESLLQILHQNTGDLHRQGWSQPPGATWLVYERPEWLTQVRPVSGLTARASAPPTFARYAVSSAVLPRLKDTISIGERMRVALMSRAGLGHPDTLALFAGKDADGKPLQGQEHAFYLPADDDGDGRIDHIVVYARSGFDESCRAALESLHRIWGHGGHDLYLALVGFGAPADYGGLRDQRNGATALAAHARVWESRTPIILPRHTKYRRGSWIDTPEDQLRTMLAQIGRSEPVIVERTAGTHVRGAELPWYRFRRERSQGGGRRAGSTGHGFRITFAEPIQGPIAVGYGAHVGLGQFVGVQ